MSTKPQSLTYQHLTDAIAKLPPYSPPPQIYYTPFATKEETVTRTWKERLFTRPWRPLQRTKLQFQPAIYMVNLPPLGLPGLPISSRRQPPTFIAHPAFKDAIEKALKGQSQ